MNINLNVSRLRTLPRAIPASQHHCMLLRLKVVVEVGAMLSAQLIRRLLKRLCQVLAPLTRVATSFAQRLRILLFCFRRFLTKIHTSPRHSTESSSSESPPESYTVSTIASSECHPSFPLPLYNTLAPAANSTQDIVSSSSPASTTPVPSIVLRRTSLHAEVNDSNANGSRIRVNFTPVHASNIIRYENCRHAYVVIALYHNSG